MKWFTSASPDARQALLAAQLGWALDAADVMLYAFALTTIQAEFGLSSATAGALASVTLISSALGGAIAGYLADRYGRARVLIYSILTYSLFTAATATANSVSELVVWRTLVGLGLGAEWSAGSVLVAETWPAEHRGKAIGFMQSGWALGYMLAAVVAAAVIPRFGWRPLFALGVLPALLTVWIRRRVKEPKIWQRSSREHFAPLRELKPVLGRFFLSVSVCTALLFAYWGLFTWIPAFLASPVSRGGAGLGLVRSTPWILLTQVGAFFGYVLFGFVSDRAGRKPSTMVFVLAAAVLVPIYATAAQRPAVLLALGPLLGFFGHGYFSVFGAWLAELFPSTIRATAQGLAYNSGRAVSAAAPFTVGAAADRWGLASGLALTSAFFFAGAALIAFLPETKGKELA